MLYAIASDYDAAVSLALTLSSICNTRTSWIFNEVSTLCASIVIDKNCDRERRKASAEKRMAKASKSEIQLKYKRQLEKENAWRNFEAKEFWH